MKRSILNHPWIRNHFPRWRWKLALMGGAPILGVVTAIAVTPEPTLPPEVVADVVEALDVAAGAPIDQGGDLYLHEARINRGDTFGAVLARLHIEDEDARRYLLFAPETQVLHRQLVPGRVVFARVTGSGQLLDLHFPMNGGNTATLVERQAEGQFVTREQALHYESQPVMKTGEIRYSLFGATDSAGIPDGIAVQMAEIFSGDIDFHRDLRKGDRFTLVYDVQRYPGQIAPRAGRILSAEFVNGGRTYQAFYYEENGKGGYYDTEGKSLKKAFLRSPLTFSRITSGFSMRLHPILKTWRAHKGVDYGAPIGTPVRATGNGVVQFAGTSGGYGNFVLLSHAGNYQTAYAHLSSFAPGLKKGDRVSQGDTIAYSGNTGWATGPHLHYEFRVNGVQVDPVRLSIPEAPPLSAEQLISFGQQAQTQLALLQLLRDTPATRFE
ncbi:MAG: M23 family metallopeptidase [Zoogloeaceae bacterium]|jgi:murein DD-endopeptidase MepM/ murein hydrolase activator NlpD|nr:M23 family metallopeptidase [Zoogloeaceae bacterium]